MPNYRLTLSFEGTAYRGWQIQPEGATVQGTVARAIAETVACEVTLHGCGRTDAGVHAEEYTANFMTDKELPCERMLGAINSRLPKDIAGTTCEIATDNFHARACAVGKVYRYTIHAYGVRPVIDRNFVTFSRRRLDVDAMREAARCLVGEHDFASFVTQHDPAKNTVRTINALDIETDGRYIIITVKGNGFLYNMVRTIVGCLMTVGRGRQKPEWLRQVLDACDRTQASETAPARGLTMVRAIYDNPSHGTP